MSAAISRGKRSGGTTPFRKFPPPKRDTGMKRKIPMPDSPGNNNASGSGKLWNDLPEKERMAVILRDVEGFSTSEVAEILGSSEGTVRSQICRGRLRIKEAMDRNDRRAFMNCNRTRNLLHCMPAETCQRRSGQDESRICRNARNASGSARAWRTTNCCCDRFAGNQWPASALAEMRAGTVFPTGEASSVLGWWIRLERLPLLGFAETAFAVAGVALAVIVSATLFAQLRHVTANPDDARGV